MPWPALPAGTKLAGAIWAAIRGYVDDSNAAAMAAGTAFAATIKFGTTAYAPTSMVATYQQVGKRVWASYLVTFSAAVPAAGALLLSLPVSARRVGDGIIVGLARLQDLSTGAVVVMAARGNGPLEIALVTDGGGFATKTGPWTWATGDTIRLTICYEAS